MSFRTTRSLTVSRRAFFALLKIVCTVSMTSGLLLQAQDRLTAPIDESVRVALPNSVPAAIAQATTSTAVDPAMPMKHMILTLQPNGAQQVALAKLIAQQTDPTSANYHKFLSTAQFASSFGASANDTAKVTAWLAAQGFQVEQVTPSRLAIVFSGTAAQVGRTFGTEIRQYMVAGQAHYANASAIQVPAALAEVVGGLARLHSFQSQPAMTGFKNLKGLNTSGLNTSGSVHYLAPADYAVIYDLQPLYSASVNGSGQGIAVVGRSNILPSDIASFRSEYGLAANAPTVVLATGSDPGFTGDGDAVEATLDVEWAGAVAPNATVYLVIAASTNTADGVDLAAQYAVNHSVAPILSVSFGSCEAVANNSFYNLLWQQAAAQGMTVFVSAGDSGVAGCQGSNDVYGTSRAVNGLCSSPYSTCVGGTEFNEGSNPGQYWLAGNNAAMGSAISYIPEMVWNESGLAAGGSNLTAGGGGTSSIYTKPVWQAGFGVPVDGQRDVPDVSLTAAQHDGYLLTFSGTASVVSGTSASAPSMAAIMSLVTQQYGAQGLANPNFYALATQQYSGGAGVFHDITIGNNSVPGVTGYSATHGYDQTSGLGSVDGAVLVNNWNSISKTFSLTSSLANVPATPSQSGSATLTLTAAGGFSASVALSLTTLPAGIYAQLSPTSIAGGNGSSTLTVLVGKSALTGSYPLTITATGGGITKTITLTVAVTVTTGCTLAASPTSLGVVQGRGTSTTLSCTNAQGIFATNLTLAVSGLPTGVTAAFLPATLLPGSGTSVLTVNVATSAAAGTYAITVTSTLPNSSPLFSQTVSVALTVSAANTFTVLPSSTSVVLPQLGSATIMATTAHSGSFNGAIKLSLTGMPTGVTGTLSTNTIAAPGDGSVTVTLQASITAVPGTYTGILWAISGGLTLNMPFSIQITGAPAYTFAISQNTLLIRNGGAAGSVNATVSSLVNGFNAAVTLAVVGLPTGVTATFTPASLVAPGSGTSVLSLTAASTATTGVIKISVTATSGSLVRSVPLQLTITPTPTFTLKASVPSYSLVSGDTLTETISATGLYGYNSTIALTTSVLPAGISVVFGSTSMSGYDGTSTMKIQTGTGLAAGTYSIVVVGTDSVAGIAQTATINITAGTVTTTISPVSLTIVPGGSVSATVTATPTMYTGNASFYLTTLPVGISYAFTSPSLIGGGGTSTLQINATSFTTPGVYQINVHTTTGGVFTLTPFTLVVQ